MSDIYFILFQRNEVKQELQMVMENLSDVTKILKRIVKLVTPKQIFNEKTKGAVPLIALSVRKGLSMLQAVAGGVYPVKHCAVVCGFSNLRIYGWPKASKVSLAGPTNGSAAADGISFVQNKKHVCKENFYLIKFDFMVEKVEKKCAKKGERAKFFCVRKMCAGLKFKMAANQKKKKNVFWGFMGDFRGGISINVFCSKPRFWVIGQKIYKITKPWFMVRGVNDDGHVANFVETEQLIHIDTMDDVVLSYLQTRGSVPLYWEQPGVNLGSHKIKMSREPAVSQQAFQKHMRFMRERYGQQVVINLLGTGVTGKSQGEAGISHIFQHQHLTCPWSKDSQHVVFDFHQECRGGNVDNLAKKLKIQLNKEIVNFGYFCSRKGKVQSETYRTMAMAC
ncbi:unnamed protein product, partial [Meganyctiphanes norvegica]